MSLILQQSFPLIISLLSIFLIYKIGIIKGILFLFLFYKFYDFIMLKLFKLQRLTAGDLTFVWSRHKETYDIILALPLDKMNVDSIINLIIEKGFKKVRRLRSKLVYRFFEWWWEEVPIKDCINRIEIRDGKSVGVFKSKQEFVDYAKKELSIKFDLEKELPFKFILYKNDEEGYHEFKNLLLIKMNHVVTDGLGAIKLICALADNYDRKLFPALMTKPIDIKTRILIEILTPFYAFVVLYRVMIVLKPTQTIFKTDKPISGVPVVALSDKISFKYYNEINKCLKITFNDLMASAVASACKKLSKIMSNGNNNSSNNSIWDPSYILMVTPVGFTTMPKNFEGLDLCNNTTGLGNKIKLVDDERQEFEIVSNDFGKITRNIYLARATKFLTDFMLNYLPHYIVGLIIRNFYSNCDITISNVPGPRDKLIYAGSTILDIIPITTTGFSHVFTGILSYSGSFRILICLDSNLNLNPEQFLDCINQELKKISDNYGKNLELSKEN